MSTAEPGRSAERDVRTDDRKFFTPTTAANQGTFTARDWALFLSVAGHLGFVVPVHRRRPRSAAAGRRHAPAGRIRGCRTGAASPASGSPSSEPTACDWSRCRCCGWRSPSRSSRSPSSTSTPPWPGCSTAARRSSPRSSPRSCCASRHAGAQLLGIAVGFVGVALVSLPSLDDGGSEALGVDPRDRRHRVLRILGQHRRPAPAAVRVAQPDGRTC